jgi:hypothetical protein
MNGSDFGGGNPEVSIADDTTPENEKSKIDAASAGPAVAVKSAVKAASKRCLIAVPSKGPRIEAGTIRVLSYSIVAAVRHCARGFGVPNIFVVRRF